MHLASQRSRSKQFDGLDVTTCEEVRKYLGLETQRQWSDLAIARTTPP